MAQRKNQPVINQPSPFSLPMFIQENTKTFWGILTALITASAYMLSNHFHLFEPRLLLMTSWDDAVPFIPYSVWVYASEYAFFIITYFFLQNTFNINRLFYAFMSIQIFSGAIFVFFPTIYPRDLFPLNPNHMDTLTFYLFQSIREADSPANCCPSLHVSSVLICAFAFLNEQRKKFPLFFLWAFFIALSTLTTKQHYIVDFLTGGFMAVGAHFFFHHGMQYHAINVFSQAAEEANSKKAS